jgi:3-oxoacyl-[acyl-carrier-protein] synthase III
MACHQSKRMARIIGCGMTALRNGKLAREHPSNAVALMVEALQLAVQDAGLNIGELDTLIALPSLMSEQHFMIGHAVAQQVNHWCRAGSLGCTPAAVLLLLRLADA